MYKINNLIKTWVDFLLNIGIKLEKDHNNNFNYNINVKNNNNFNYTIDFYYKENTINEQGWLVDYKLNKKQIMDINMYFKSKHILVYPDFDWYKLSITIFLDEYLNELRLKKINKLLKV